MNLKLLIILGFLCGCGGGDSGGSGNSSSNSGTGTIAPSCTTDPLLVGTWDNNYFSNVTAAIKSNCIATSDYCGSTRTITQTTSELDKYQVLTMVVATSNDSIGCLPIGTYQCLYSVYDVNGVRQMSFKCSNSTTTGSTAHYTKID